jgi:hypothetical protein
MVLVVSMIIGCNVAGPSSVREGRSNYNEAVQLTSKQQLLLNIVRLRYRDTVFFMEVASVSTSFELGGNVAGSATLPESVSKTYGLSAGMTYMEKPTVTYTPLQGDKFVAQLMSPVQPKVLLLLYHSGWSVERIFRILLQNMDMLANAPSASGPTPQRVPVYRDFLRSVDLMRELQKRGTLHLGLVSEASADGEDPLAGENLEIAFREGPADCAEVRELYELLDLAPDRRRFLFHIGVGDVGADSITVLPRSLMAAFFYVSQGVEVPAGDEEAGRVTVTRYEDGRRFDWGELTGDLFRVRCSSLPPANAFVSVRYRGHWFYIDDSDLSTKSTFSLLTQLLALQGGEIESMGPILTLPVTR